MGKSQADAHQPRDDKEGEGERRRERSVKTRDMQKQGR